VHCPRKGVWGLSRQGSRADGQHDYTQHQAESTSKSSIVIPDLGKGKLDPPHFSLVTKTVLSDGFEFGVAVMMLSVDVLAHYCHGGLWMSTLIHIGTHRRADSKGRRGTCAKTISGYFHYETDGEHIVGLGVTAGSHGELLATEVLDVVVVGARLSIVAIGFCQN
jgi:hypothetical protein